MSRSWVVRFHSGSALVALLAGLLSASGSAQEEPWLKRSREILEQAPDAPAPAWLRREPTPEAAAAASEIANRSQPNLAESSNASPGTGRVYIFGSLSIPPATLRNLFDEASTADTVFVLRGIPKGATIQSAIADIKRLCADPKRVPNVIIDPTLFRRHGITTVPTLLLERGNQKPVTVIGAVTVDWLRRMAANVTAGGEALGRRAESYDIGEPDFILEMQARLAAIDWEAKRAAAMDAFWRKPHQFVDLPDATQRREFVVDPSVRVTQDLEDADGNVVVQAGETFNPLRWAPLSKTIVVFRGTDPRQVRQAAQAAAEARSKGHGVILLTTTVDTSRGWQHLNELEQTLTGAVYVLPSTLVERFRLEHLPSTVVSRGEQLVVTELPVGAEK